MATKWEKLRNFAGGGRFGLAALWVVGWKVWSCCAMGW